MKFHPEVPELEGKTRKHIEFAIFTIRVIFEFRETSICRFHRVFLRHREMLGCIERNESFSRKKKPLAMGL